MVCMGLEPGAAGQKVLTNSLSYGGTPSLLTNSMAPSQVENVNLVSGSIWKESNS